MSKLNISPSVSLLVPLPQSNGGGVHGYNHGGSEGSNQRAGEADTERRPIQVSHLHGEYAHYCTPATQCQHCALRNRRLISSICNLATSCGSSLCKLPHAPSTLDRRPQTSGLSLWSHCTLHVFGLRRSSVTGNCLTEMTQDVRNGSQA